VGHGYRPDSLHRLQCLCGRVPSGEQTFLWSRSCAAVRCTG
jgi:hypothetical protein